MAERYSAQEMLARLVSFPTVSARSNLDLIEFVESYLAGHGIASTRVPDATGTKAALHAVVGPRVDNGVVLSAHTDVVPVEGQAWSSDPFTLREADGRLYGRGTCDMKGFAALMLAAVPDMAVFHYASIIPQISWHIPDKPLFKAINLIRNFFAIQVLRFGRHLEACFAD